MSDKFDKDKRGPGRKFSAPRDRDAGKAKPFADRRDGGKPFAKGRPGKDFSRPKPTGVVRPAETEERIAKVIARAGIASRRDAEALIAEGRVTLDGEVLTSPAINVGPFAKITIDGEPLPERERTRLWLYHKPRGLVTTARDPEGRPTVFENLPEDMPRVVSIGRLDINTEGLLLLTNDGGLARVIAHPSTGWLRRYKVRAHGDVTQADLDKLADGITIDDIEYGPVEARLDRVQGDNAWLTLGLREGKNREVKRILEFMGLSVNRLIRLSFGPFQLGDLEPGLAEEIRTKVLKEQLGETLAAEANVDFERPVREPVATHAPKRYLDDVADEDEDDPHAMRREQELARAIERREHRRAVWRAGELDEKPHGKGKQPRRGADPKEARAALAARPRQRAGTIESGSGRAVRVERFVPQPGDEEKPRRGPASGGERPFRDDRDFADRPPRRSFGDQERPARFGDAPRGARPFARGGEGEDRPRKPFTRREDSFGDRDRSRSGDDRRGARPFSRGPEGEDRPRKPFVRREGGFGDRDRSRSGDDRRGARPFSRSPEGEDRPRKPFARREESFGNRDRDRPEGGRPEGKRPQGKSFGGKSFGGKSFGGKPSRGGPPRGGKPFGGKPSGGKPFGNKPGGRGR